MKKLIYTILPSDNLEEFNLIRLFHQSVRNIYAKEEVEFGVICKSNTWLRLNLNETHISNTSLFSDLDEDHPFNSILNVPGKNDYCANKFLIHELIPYNQYSLITYLDYDSIVCADFLSDIEDLSSLHLHSYNDSDTPHSGLFSFYPCQATEKLFKDIYKNYLDNILFDFGSYIKEHADNIKLSFNITNMVWSYVPTAENMERKFINFGKANMKQLPDIWKFNGNKISCSNKLSAMNKCLELCKNV